MRRVTALMLAAAVALPEAGLIPVGLASAEPAAPGVSASARPMGGFGGVPYSVRDLRPVAFYPADASKTLVIHLQDPHAAVGAQESIARGLDAWIGSLGVRRVFVEGGWGDCGLSAARAAKGDEYWRDRARGMLLDGRLAGEEYLNLTGPSDFSITGIEDRVLYLRSVRLFARIRSARDRVTAFLNRAEAHADAILARSLDEPSRGFMTALDREREPLARWRLVKGRMSRAGVRLDRRSLLSRIDAVWEREAALPDPSSGARLDADWLAARMPRLIRELEAVEKRTILGLLKDPDALTAWKIRTHVRLLKSASHLGLTPADAEALRAAVRAMPSVSWQAWINRRLREAGSNERLLAEDRFEPFLADVLWFYRLTGRRDRAFVHNISSSLKGPDASGASRTAPVVLIAGGHHTGPLVRRLNAAGHPVAVFAPVIEFEGDSVQYEERLLRGVLTKVALPSAVSVRSTASDLRKIAAALTPEFASFSAAVDLKSDSVTMSAITLETRSADGTSAARMADPTDRSNQTGVIAADLQASAWLREWHIRLEASITRPRSVSAWQRLADKILGSNPVEVAVNLAARDAMRRGPEFVSSVLRAIAVEGERVGSTSLLRSAREDFSIKLLERLGQSVNTRRNFLKSTALFLAGDQIELLKKAGRVAVNIGFNPWVKLTTQAGQTQLESVMISGLQYLSEEGQRQLESVINRPQYPGLDSEGISRRRLVHLWNEFGPDEMLRKLGFKGIGSEILYENAVLSIQKEEAWGRVQVRLPHARTDRLFHEAHNYFRALKLSHDPADRTEGRLADYVSRMCDGALELGLLYQKPDLISAGSGEDQGLDVSASASHDHGVVADRTVKVEPAVETVDTTTFQPLIGVDGIDLWPGIYPREMGFETDPDDLVQSLGAVSAAITYAKNEKYLDRRQDASGSGSVRIWELGTGSGIGALAWLTAAEKSGVPARIDVDDFNDASGPNVMRNMRRWSDASPHARRIVRMDDESIDFESGSVLRFRRSATGIESADPEDRYDIIYFNAPSVGSEENVGSDDLAHNYQMSTSDMAALVGTMLSHLGPGGVALIQTSADALKISFREMSAAGIIEGSFEHQFVAPDPEIGSRQLIALRKTVPSVRGSGGEPGARMAETGGYDLQGEHQQNEDAHFHKVLASGIVIAGVFDGIGQSEDGAMASRVVSESMQAELERGLDKIGRSILWKLGLRSVSEGSARRLIRKAFQNAHARLREAHEELRRLSAGGDSKADEDYASATTASLVVAMPERPLRWFKAPQAVRDWRVITGNIGDSRSYQSGKEGSLRPLTLDNVDANAPASVVEQRRIVQGFLSSVRDAADLTDVWKEIFIARNQTVGVHPRHRKPDPRIQSFRVPGSDRLVLLTDGISDVATNEEIAEWMMDAWGDLPASAARRVLEAARSRQEDTGNIRAKRRRDDMTAVVIQLDPDPEASPSGSWSLKPRIPHGMASGPWWQAPRDAFIADAIRLFKISGPDSFGQELDLREVLSDPVWRVETMDASRPDPAASAAADVTWFAGHDPIFDDGFVYNGQWPLPDPDWRRRAVKIGDVYFVDSFLKGPFEAARETAGAGAPRVIYLADFQSSLTNQHKNFTPYAVSAVREVLRMDVRDKVVWEAGSADGILSLISLLNGAQKVILTEKEEGEFDWFRSHLTANGMDPDRLEREGRLRFIRADLNDIGARVEEMRAESPDILLSDIGPHYGRAEESVLMIADRLDSLKTLLVAGHEHAWPAGRSGRTPGTSNFFQKIQAGDTLSANFNTSALRLKEGRGWRAVSASTTVWEGLRVGQRHYPRTDLMAVRYDRTPASGAGVRMADRMSPDRDAQGRVVLPPNLELRAPRDPAMLMALYLIFSLHPASLTAVKAAKPIRYVIAYDDDAAFQDSMIGLCIKGAFQHAEVFGLQTGITLREPHHGKEYIVLPARYRKHPAQVAYALAVHLIEDTQPILTANQINDFLEKSLEIFSRLQERGNAKHPLVGKMIRGLKRLNEGVFYMAARMALSDGYSEGYRYGEAVALIRRQEGRPVDIDDAERWLKRVHSRTLKDFYEGMIAGYADVLGGGSAAGTRSRPGGARMAVTSHAAGWDRDVRTGAETLSRMLAKVDGRKRDAIQRGKIMIAGPGRHLGDIELMLSVFPDMGSLTVLEPNPQNVSKLRADLKKNHPLEKRIRIVKGGLERVPTEDGTFDVIFTDQVIDPSVFLAETPGSDDRIGGWVKEIGRVLAPGGVYLTLSSQRKYFGGWFVPSEYPHHYFIAGKSADIFAKPRSADRIRQMVSGARLSDAEIGSALAELPSSLSALGDGKLFSVRSAYQRGSAGAALEFAVWLEDSEGVAGYFHFSVDPFSGHGWADWAHLSSGGIVVPEWGAHSAALNVRHDIRSGYRGASTTLMGLAFRIAESLVARAHPDPDRAPKVQFVIDSTDMSEGFYDRLDPGADHGAGSFRTFRIGSRWGEHQTPVLPLQIEKAEWKANPAHYDAVDAVWEAGDKVYDLSRIWRPAAEVSRRRLHRTLARILNDSDPRKQNYWPWDAGNVVVPAARQRREAMSRASADLKSIEGPGVRAYLHTDPSGEPNGYAYLRLGSAESPVSASTILGLKVSDARRPFEVGAHLMDRMLSAASAVPVDVTVEVRSGGSEEAFYIDYFARHDILAKRDRDGFSIPFHAVHARAKRAEEGLWPPVPQPVPGERPIDLAARRMRHVQALLHRIYRIDRSPEVTGRVVGGPGVPDRILKRDFHAWASGHAGEDGDGWKTSIGPVTGIGVMVSSVKKRNEQKGPLADHAIDAMKAELAAASQSMESTLQVFRTVADRRYLKMSDKYLRYQGTDNDPVPYAMIGPFIVYNAFERRDPDGNKHREFVRAVNELEFVWKDLVTGFGEVLDALPRSGSGARMAESVSIGSDVGTRVVQADGLDAESRRVALRKELERFRAAAAESGHPLAHLDLAVGLRHLASASPIDEREALLTEARKVLSPFTVGPSPYPQILTEAGVGLLAQARLLMSRLDARSAGAQEASLLFYRFRRMVQEASDMFEKVGRGDPRSASYFRALASRGEAESLMAWGYERAEKHHLRGLGKRTRVMRFQHAVRGVEIAVGGIDRELGVRAYPHSTAVYRSILEKWSSAANLLIKTAPWADELLPRLAELNRRAKASMELVMQRLDPTDASTEAAVLHAHRLAAEFDMVLAEHEAAKEDVVDAALNVIREANAYDPGRDQEIIRRSAHEKRSPAGRIKAVRKKIIDELLGRYPISGWQAIVIQGWTLLDQNERRSDQAAQALYDWLEGLAPEGRPDTFDKFRSELVSDTFRFYGLDVQPQVDALDPSLAASGLAAEADGQGPSGLAVRSSAPAVAAISAQRSKALQEKIQRVLEDSAPFRAWWTVRQRERMDEERDVIERELTSGSIDAAFKRFEAWGHLAVGWRERTAAEVSQSVSRQKDRLRKVESDLNVLEKHYQMDLFGHVREDVRAALERLGLQDVLVAGPDMLNVIASAAGEAESIALTLGPTSAEYREAKTLERIEGKLKEIGSANELEEWILEVRTRAQKASEKLRDRLLTESQEAAASDLAGMAGEVFIEIERLQKERAAIAALEQEAEERAEFIRLVQPGSSHPQELENLLRSVKSSYRPVYGVDFLSSEPVTALRRGIDEDGSYEELAEIEAERRRVWGEAVREQILVLRSHISRYELTARRMGLPPERDLNRAVGALQEYLIAVEGIAGEHAATLRVPDEGALQVDPEVVARAYEAAESLTNNLYGRALNTLMARMLQVISAYLAELNLPSKNKGGLIYTKGASLQEYDTIVQTDIHGAWTDYRVNIVRSAGTEVIDAAEFKNRVEQKPKSVLSAWKAAEDLEGRPWKFDLLADGAVRLIEELLRRERDGDRSVLDVESAFRASLMAEKGLLRQRVETPHRIGGMKVTADAPRTEDKVQVREDLQSIVTTPEDPVGQEEEMVVDQWKQLKSGARMAAGQSTEPGGSYLERPAEYYLDEGLPHHEVLGVASGGVGLDVLRDHWKRLIQKWHPDHHPNDEKRTNKISQRINEAYQTLRDRLRRGSRAGGPDRAAGPGSSRQRSGRSRSDDVGSSWSARSFDYTPEEQALFAGLRDRRKSVSTVSIIELEQIARKQPDKIIQGAVSMLREPVSFSNVLGPTFAAWLLVEIGTHEALRQLFTFLHEPWSWGDPMVRAQRESIELAFAQRMKNPEGVAALRSELNRIPMNGREYAASGLASVGTEEAIDALRAKFDQDLSERSGDGEYRVYIVHALRAFDNPAAWPEVRGWLEQIRDHDPDKNHVAFNAKIALEMLDEKFGRLAKLLPATGSSGARMAQAFVKWGEKRTIDADWKTALYTPAELKRLLPVYLKMDHDKLEWTVYPRAGINPWKFIVSIERVGKGAQESLRASAAAITRHYAAASKTMKDEGSNPFSPKNVYRLQRYMPAMELADVLRRIDRFDISGYSILEVRKILGGKGVYAHGTMGFGFDHKDKRAIQLKFYWALLNIMLEDGRVEGGVAPILNEREAKSQNFEVDGEGHLTGMRVTYRDSFHYGPIQVVFRETDNARYNRILGRRTTHDDHAIYLVPTQDVKRWILGAMREARKKKLVSAQQVRRTTAKLLTYDELVQVRDHVDAILAGTISPSAALAQALPSGSGARMADLAKLGNRVYLEGRRIRLRLSELPDGPAKRILIFISQEYERQATVFGGAIPDILDPDGYVEPRDVDILFRREGDLRLLDKEGLVALDEERGVWELVMPDRDATHVIGPSDHRIFRDEHANLSVNRLRLVFDRRGDPYIDESTGGSLADVLERRARLVVGRSRASSSYEALERAAKRITKSRLGLDEAVLGSINEAFEYGHTHWFESLAALDQRHQSTLEQLEKLGLRATVVKPSMPADERKDRESALRAARILTEYLRQVEPGALERIPAMAKFTSDPETSELTASDTGARMADGPDQPYVEFGTGEAKGLLGADRMVFLPGMYPRLDEDPVRQADFDQSARAVSLAIEQAMERRLIGPDKQRAGAGPLLIREIGAGAGIAVLAWLTRAERSGEAALLDVDDIDPRFAANLRQNLRIWSEQGPGRRILEDRGGGGTVNFENGSRVRIRRTRPGQDPFAGMNKKYSIVYFNAPVVLSETASGEDLEGPATSIKSSGLAGVLRSSLEGVAEGGIMLMESTDDTFDGRMPELQQEKWDPQGWFTVERRMLGTDPDDVRALFIFKRQDLPAVPVMGGDETWGGFAARQLRHMHELMDTLYDVSPGVRLHAVLKGDGERSDQWFERDFGSWLTGHAGSRRFEEIPVIANKLFALDNWHGAVEFHESGHAIDQAELTELEEGARGALNMVHDAVRIYQTVVDKRYMEHASKLARYDGTHDNPVPYQLIGPFLAYDTFERRDPDGRRYRAFVRAVGALRGSVGALTRTMEKRFELLRSSALPAPEGARMAMDRRGFVKKGVASLVAMGSMKRDVRSQDRAVLTIQDPREKLRDLNGKAELEIDPARASAVRDLAQKIQRSRMDAAVRGSADFMTAELLAAAQAIDAGLAEDLSALQTASLKDPSRQLSVLTAEEAWCLNRLNLRHLARTGCLLWKDLYAAWPGSGNDALREVFEPGTEIVQVDGKSVYLMRGVARFGYTTDTIGFTPQNAGIAFVDLRRVMAEAIKIHGQMEIWKKRPPASAFDKAAQKLFEKDFADLSMADIARKIAIGIAENELSHARDNVGSDEIAGFEPRSDYAEIAGRDTAPFWAISRMARNALVSNIYGVEEQLALWRIGNRILSGRGLAKAFPILLVDGYNEKVALLSRLMDLAAGSAEQELRATPAALHLELYKRPTRSGARMAKPVQNHGAEPDISGYRQIEAPLTMYESEGSINGDLEDLERVYGKSIEDSMARLEARGGGRVLFVGAGRGYAVIDLNLKYPNIRIDSINREAGLLADFEHVLKHVGQKMRTQTQRAGSLSEREIRQISRRELVRLHSSAMVEDLSFSLLMEGIAGMYDLIIFGTETLQYVTDPLAAVGMLYGHLKNEGELFTSGYRIEVGLSGQKDRWRRLELDELLGSLESDISSQARSVAADGPGNIIFTKVPGRSLRFPFEHIEHVSIFGGSMFGTVYDRYKDLRTAEAGAMLDKPKGSGARMAGSREDGSQAEAELLDYFKRIFAPLQGVPNKKLQAEFKTIADQHGPEIFKKITRIRMTHARKALIDNDARAYYSWIWSGSPDCGACYRVQAILYEALRSTGIPADTKNAMRGSVSYHGYLLVGSGRDRFAVDLAAGQFIPAYIGRPAIGRPEAYQAELETAVMGRYEPGYLRRLKQRFNYFRTVVFPRMRTQRLGQRAGDFERDFERRSSRARPVSAPGSEKASQAARRGPIFLDIGAGSGGVTVHLAEKNPNATVIAFEPKFSNPEHSGLTTITSRVPNVVPIPSKIEDRPVSAYAHRVERAFWFFPVAKIEALGAIASRIDAYLTPGGTFTMITEQDNPLAETFSAELSGLGFEISSTDSLAFIDLPKYEPLIEHSDWYALNRLTYRMSERIHKYRVIEARRAAAGPARVAGQAGLADVAQAARKDPAVGRLADGARLAVEARGQAAYVSVLKQNGPARIRVESRPFDLTVELEAAGAGGTDRIDIAAAPRELDRLSQVISRAERVLRSDARAAAAVVERVDLDHWLSDAQDAEFADRLGLIIAQLERIRKRGWRVEYSAASGLRSRLMGRIAEMPKARDILDLIADVPGSSQVLDAPVVAVLGPRHGLLKEAASRETLARDVRGRPMAYLLLAERDPNEAWTLADLEAASLSARVLGVQPADSGPGREAVEFFSTVFGGQADPARLLDFRQGKAGSRFELLKKLTLRLHRWADRVLHDTMLARQITGRSA